MKLWSVVLTGVACVALMLGSSAAEEAAKGKAVTLSGTLVCGKCTLSETDKCTNVLQVKEGGKTVNYYLQDGGNKAKYHGGVCPAGSMKDATVTGTVATKDGKMVLTPTKVDVK